LGVDAASAQVMMDDGFDFGFQQPRAALRVPDDVQIDLGVVVASHVEPPGAALKRNSEKPRKRGWQAELSGPDHPPWTAGCGNIIPHKEPRSRGFSRFGLSQ